MKKIIMATALISALGFSTAFAADEVAPSVQKLQSEFSLTDDQVKRIQKVISHKKDMAEKRSKRMERRMERMKEKLGLSDEQVAKIKALREEQQAARKAAREAEQAKMDAILTPEQKEKFEAMKEKRSHHKGRRGGKKRGHGHHGYGRCGGKSKGKDDDKS